MTRRTYPWSAIVADRRAHPKIWALPESLVGVPARLAQSIRLRRHPDLRVRDGVLETWPTGAYVNDEGRKVLNVWVRWMPNRKEDR